MSKAHVILSSPRGGFGVDRTAWREVAAAVAEGGQRTWDLAHGFYRVREFTRYLGERYEHGDLHQIVHHGGDEHTPVLSCRRGEMKLTVRPIGEQRPDSGPHWGMAAEATISERDLDVARIYFVAEGSGFLGVAVVLGRCLRSIAGYFSKCRAVDSAAEVEGELDAAEEEAVTAAAEETEEATIACSGVAGLAAGVALIAVGMVVEFLLSNVMHHKLIVYNATDVDLEWEIAHIDAGSVYQVPRPYHGNQTGAHGSIPKVGELYGVKLGRYGVFSSQTSEFAEGVGYLLRFRPGGGLTHGAWAKVQVPYWGDNSVRVSAAREGGSAGDLWDRWDDSYQWLHTAERHGAYTLKMSQDYLDDEHTSADNPNANGYYYNSVLTFERKGIWG